jgi:uncharacterized membrane protein YbhN (UPF0104 family)
MTAVTTYLPRRAQEAPRRQAAAAPQPSPGASLGLCQHQPSEGPGLTQRGSSRSWARRLSGVLVAAGAAAFATLDGRSLTAAATALGNVRAAWLGLALGAEAASLVSFGLLQRALLRATGDPRGRERVVAVTLAGAALSKFLPGGAATEGVWAYRQLHRQGVLRARAIWVLLAAGALSYFALFVVLVAGIEAAGGRGPVASLRWPAAGLAAVPLIAGLAGTLLYRSGRLGRVARLGPHPSMGASPRWARWWVAMHCCRLGARGWSRSFIWAMANWALDGAALAASIEALQVTVPWRGVVAAYALAQVAGTLPLTPGGLGLVEASLAGLLAAYGMHAPEALAAVVLYRAVGFWVVAVVGGAAGLQLRRAPGRPSTWRQLRLSRPVLAVRGPRSVDLFGLHGSGHPQPAGALVTAQSGEAKSARSLCRVSELRPRPTGWHPQGRPG